MIMNILTFMDGYSNRPGCMGWKLVAGWSGMFEFEGVTKWRMYTKVVFEN